MSDTDRQQPPDDAARLGERDEQRLRGWPRDRIKPQAVARGLTQLLAALDAERSRMAAACASAAVLREALQVELKIDEQEIRACCSEMPERKADWYVRESIRGKRLRAALAAAPAAAPTAERGARPLWDVPCLTCGDRLGSHELRPSEDWTGRCMESGCACSTPSFNFESFGPAQAQAQAPAPAAPAEGDDDGE